MKDGQLIGEMVDGLGSDDHKTAEEIDMMKTSKVYILLTMLYSLFLLACGIFSLERQYFLYDLNYRNISEIEQISLVIYGNPIIDEDPSDNNQYDVEKLTILKTLNSEEYEPFLNELSEIGGIAGTFPETISSPNGTGILITYQDGGFILITISSKNDDDCIFWGSYNSNATNDYYFGISWAEMIIDFKALIFAYFDVEF